MVIPVVRAQREPSLLRWFFYGTVVLLLAGAPGVHVDGYPSGAPLEACEAMMPSHGTGVSPQNGTSGLPFSLTTTVRKSSNRGTMVVVTINGNQTTLDYFKGFLIQARHLEGSEAIGRFYKYSWWVPLGQRPLKCFESQVFTAITHADYGNKLAVSMNWYPESNRDLSDLVFVATIVQSKDIFWVNVTSDILFPTSTTTPQGTPSETTTTFPRITPSMTTPPTTKMAELTSESTTLATPTTTHYPSTTTESPKRPQTTSASTTVISSATIVTTVDLTTPSFSTKDTITLSTTLPAATTADIKPTVNQTTEPGKFTTLNSTSTATNASSTTVATTEISTNFTVDAVTKSSATITNTETARNATVNSTDTSTVAPTNVTTAASTTAFTTENPAENRTDSNATHYASTPSSSVTTDFSLNTTAVMNGTTELPADNFTTVTNVTDVFRSTTSSGYNLTTTPAAATRNATLSPEFTTESPMTYTRNVSSTQATTRNVTTENPTIVTSNNFTFVTTIHPANVTENSTILTTVYPANVTKNSTILTTVSPANVTNNSTILPTENTINTTESPTKATSFANFTTTVEPNLSTVLTTLSTTQIITREITTTAQDNITTSQMTTRDNTTTTQATTRFSSNSTTVVARTTADSSHNFTTTDDVTTDDEMLTSYTTAETPEDTSTVPSTSVVTDVTNIVTEVTTTESTRSSNATELPSTNASTVLISTTRFTTTLPPTTADITTKIETKPNPTTTNLPSTTVATTRLLTTTDATTREQTVATTPATTTSSTTVAATTPEATVAPTRATTSVPTTRSTPRKTTEQRQTTTAAANATSNATAGATNAITESTMITTRSETVGTRTRMTTAQPQVAEADNEVIVRFRITNLEFKDDLDQPGSPGFRDLATDVENSMREVYKNEAVPPSNITVIRFSRGSVIPEVKLTFLSSLNDTQKNSVVQTLYNEAEDGQIGDFNVDSVSAVENGVYRPVNDCVLNPCPNDLNCLSDNCSYSCSSNPDYCLNGGDCSDTMTNDGSRTVATCSCAPNYEGSRCNEVIKEDVSSRVGLLIIILASVCGVLVVVVFVLIIMIVLWCKRWRRKKNLRTIDSDPERIEEMGRIREQRNAAQARREESASSASGTIVPIMFNKPTSLEAKPPREFVAIENVETSSGSEFYTTDSDSDSDFYPRLSQGGARFPRFNQMHGSIPDVVGPATDYEMDIMSRGNGTATSGGGNYDNGDSRSFTSGSTRMRRSVSFSDIQQVITDDNRIGFENFTFGNDVGPENSNFQVRWDFKIGRQESADDSELGADIPNPGGGRKKVEDEGGGDKSGGESAA